MKDRILENLIKLKAALDHPPKSAERMKALEEMPMFKRPEKKKAAQKKRGTHHG